MYQRNPFRLLDLPADATFAEIRRRRDELELALAAGWSSLQDRAIPQSTTRADVLEAVRALSEPEERLLHEVFWPRLSEHGFLDCGDALLECFPEVSESEAQTVLRRYGHEAETPVVEDPSPAAAIQLAVILHGVALHLERSDFLTAKERAKRKLASDLWIAAVRAWRQVFVSDALASHLVVRFRAIEHRGLSPEHANSLAERVGENLVRMHAEVLRRHWRCAADASHQRAAVFHARALLRMSKWLPPAEKVVRQVLFEARDFVHTCIEDADKMASGLLPVQPEDLGQHLATLGDAERQRLGHSLSDVVRGLVSQLAKPLSILVHTADYTDSKVVRVGKEAIGLIRGIVSVAYLVSENYPNIIELVDGALRLPLEPSSRHDLSQDRLQLGIAYVRKMANAGQWHDAEALLSRQLASVSTDEERAAWESEHRKLAAAKLGQEGVRRLDEGDLDAARDAFEKAQVYSDDDEEQQELQGAAHRIRGAIRHRRLSRVWTAAAIIVIVGVLAVLAWREENGFQDHPASSSAPRGRGGAERRSRPVPPDASPGHPVPPPTGLRWEPSSRASVPSPGDLGLARLSDEIEADKGVLRDLERKLETNRGLLVYFRKDLDSYAKRISGYEARIHAGLRINTNAYEADIESHNALVGRYNRLLEDEKQLYADHEQRRQRCNARVTRYNSMIRSK